MYICTHTHTEMLLSSTHELIHSALWKIYMCCRYAGTHTDTIHFIIDTHTHTHPSDKHAYIHIYLG